MQSGKTKNCDSYLTLTALPLLNRTRVVCTHAYRQVVVTLAISHLSSASSYVANRKFLRALPRLVFNPMMADPRIRPGCLSPLFFFPPSPPALSSIDQVHTHVQSGASQKVQHVPTNIQHPHVPSTLPSLPCDQQTRGVRYPAVSL